MIVIHTSPCIFHPTSFSRLLPPFFFFLCRLLPPLNGLCIKLHNKVIRTLFPKLVSIILPLSFLLCFARACVSVSFDLPDAVFVRDHLRIIFFCPPLFIFIFFQSSDENLIDITHSVVLLDRGRHRQLCTIHWLFFCVLHKCPEEEEHEQRPLHDGPILPVVQMVVRSRSVVQYVVDTAFFLFFLSFSSQWPNGIRERLTEHGWTAHQIFRALDRFVVC